MSKQYHYVVVYDSKTRNWGVEYDMTDMLHDREQSLYDPETTKWSGARGDEQHEDLGYNLGAILIQANAKRGGNK
jgi:hypothetical protein